MLGDDRLARMAGAGSDAAFAVLYQRHQQGLYRYCRSIVRHEADAQDALQTTMIKALDALRRAPIDAPLRPWLFRIAHNESVSLLRARRTTVDVDVDAARDRPSPSAEDRADERRRLEQLVADLAQLPERQRAALVMRELNDLSHTEIATALDVSVSGAKQAIFEARVGLQDLAKGRAMPCADVQRLISDGDGRVLRGRTVRAHLRGCAACRALRDAMRQRRSDLRALAPPLPGAISAGLVAQLFGGGGGGGGGALAGLAGKAATGTFASKLAVGAAVVAAGAGAGVEVSRLEPQHRPPTSPAAAVPASGRRAAAPAGTPSGGAPAPRPIASERPLVRPGPVRATRKPAARRPARPTTHAAERSQKAPRVGRPPASKRPGHPSVAAVAPGRVKRPPTPPSPPRGAGHRAVAPPAAAGRPEPSPAREGRSVAAKGAGRAGAVAPAPGRAAPTTPVTPASGHRPADSGPDSTQP